MSSFWFSTDFVSKTMDATSNLLSKKYDSGHQNNVLKSIRRDNRLKTNKIYLVSTNMSCLSVIIYSFVAYVAFLLPKARIRQTLNTSTVRILQVTNKQP